MGSHPSKKEKRRLPACPGQQNQTKQYNFDGTICLQFSSDKNCHDSREHGSLQYHVFAYLFCSVARRPATFPGLLPFPSAPLSPHAAWFPSVSKLNPGTDSNCVHSHRNFHASATPLPFSSITATLHVLQLALPQPIVTQLFLLFPEEGRLHCYRN